MNLSFIRRNTQKGTEAVASSVAQMLKGFGKGGQSLLNTVGQSSSASIGLFANAKPAMTPHFAPSLTPQDEQEKWNRLVPGQSNPSNVVPINSARHFGTRMDHELQRENTLFGPQQPQGAKLSPVAQFKGPQINPDNAAALAALGAKGDYSQVQQNNVVPENKEIESNVIHLKKPDNTPNNGTPWTPPTLNM